MLKLMRYLKPYRKGIALVLSLLVCQAVAELFLPTLMADIVNDGVVLGMTEGADRTPFILRTGGIMLVVALLAGVASICAMYLAPRVAAGAARDMRRELFVRVESFSQSEFDRFSSASLITRCTNDVGQVQGLANMTARMLVYAPILGIGGVVMALTRSVAMSWIIALAVVTLIGITVVITLVVMPKFKVIQRLVDDLNKIFREILRGIMVIRAFGTRRHEKRRFDDANKDLRDTGLFVARVMAAIGPALAFIMAGTQLLVIWIGARHIAASGLPIGDMMAFMQFSMQVIFAFMLVSMVLIMVPRAVVSAARINEVLETNPTIKDPERPLDIDGADAAARGRIVFDKVGFRYSGAGANAVTDITFTALPGRTTAIIGATGSGKSTVAQLLLRFYDATEGSITVGGVDIRRVRQADLRDRIGYVPQKGRLLAGTVASNIRYGKPDADDDEVRTAATVAQALDFIEGKEGRFEAEIAQGGGNVSGGQRQRLSIARALAKNPEILVFDDSFSALDFKTDAQLRRALKNHVAGATVIVIAQRVGTIMDADQILVLDEGRIAGRGTHAELLETCPAYYEIASSQGTAGTGER